MKKVLIAGATGYLGRFIVQEFKNRGYWVRALARNPKKLEKNGPFLEPAVRDQVDEVFVGEVTKLETLNGVCDGIDIIFSSIGITRPREKVSFMVSITRAILTFWSLQRRQLLKRSFLFWYSTQTKSIIWQQHARCLLRNLEIQGWNMRLFAPLHISQI